MKTKVQVCVTLEEKLVNKIDKIRAKKKLAPLSRSAYISLALVYFNNYLKNNKFKLED